MKITFLAWPYEDHPVGGKIVIYEYANRLAARGHEVTVIHGSPPSFLAKKLGFGPPRPVSVPEKHWFDFDERVAVHHVLVLDPGALPDADILFSGLAVDEYPEKGTPIGFVQGLGMFSPEDEEAWLRSPARKVCVSQWLFRKVASLGIPEGEIAYVPNGLDTETFRLLAPIEARPCRVAMLYHPLPVKGTDVGLAALALVRAQLPEVTAVLFGTFPRPDSLPGSIEYRYRPSRSELARDVYNGSAVLVCPSRAEGFYLCGVEAMASGCAFAATDVTGIRDYAEHGVTALVSPVEDAHSLAQNVVTLLTNDALRARLAGAGQKRASTFSWESSTDILEARLVEWREADLRRRAG